MLLETNFAHSLIVFALIGLKPKFFLVINIFIIRFYLSCLTKTLFSTMSCIRFQHYIQHCNDIKLYLS